MKAATVTATALGGIMFIAVGIEALPVSNFMEGGVEGDNYCDRLCEVKKSKFGLSCTTRHREKKEVLQ